MLPQIDELRYKSDSQRLWYRPSVNRAALDSAPSTKAIAVYSQDGTEILASTAMTWDDDNSILYYDLDLSDTDNYPVSDPTSSDAMWYRAIIEFSGGDSTIVRNMDFAIAREPWEPNVTSQDLFDLSDGAHYIEEVNAVPSMAVWLDQAELQIRQRFRKAHGRTAGFYQGKQDLDLALRYLCLYHYWLSKSLGGMDDLNNDKAGYWLGLYEAVWTESLSAVVWDDDQDNIDDDAEYNEGTMRVTV